MKPFLPEAQPLDIVVFDFDGVLAEPMWPAPEIGAPIKEGIDLAWAYYKQGYQITVYTSRPWHHRDRISAWLAQHGMNYVYDIVCEKPLGVLYVDDRGLRFER